MKTKNLLRQFGTSIFLVLFHPPAFASSASPTGSFNLLLNSKTFASGFKIEEGCESLLEPAVPSPLKMPIGDYKKLPVNDKIRILHQVSQVFHAQAGAPDGINLPADADIQALSPKIKFLIETSSVKKLTPFRDELAVMGYKFRILSLGNSTALNSYLRLLDGTIRLFGFYPERALESVKDFSDGTLNRDDNEILAVLYSLKSGTIIQTLNSSEDPYGTFRAAVNSIVFSGWHDRKGRPNGWALEPGIEMLIRTLAGWKNFSIGAKRKMKPEVSKFYQAWLQLYFSAQEAAEVTAFDKQRFEQIHTRMESLLYSPDIEDFPDIASSIADLVKTFHGVDGVSPKSMN
jgi:hypothetical protein